MEELMGDRKTLRNYVESGESVAGVTFMGNFGGADGDLRDYTFVDSTILKDTSVVEVRLTDGTYQGKDQVAIGVGNHLGDYAA